MAYTIWKILSSANIATDITEISGGIFDASMNKSIKYPTKLNRISAPTAQAYSDEIL